jgi:hypothetical protein
VIFTPVCLSHSAETLGYGHYGLIVLILLASKALPSQVTANR